ncbi:hypothetical protein G6F55_012560 [Rhizopus delemar]|uniref:Reverse transcriptase domain-containing protein n=1 Tax=Rhizopus delemar TaxID=936053 RepID=A0A9P6YQK8_9FUNG|nr:hypothetical protein G6F55_012560 [Rhizopus delemar]KAG1556171.1 hypothetical protein G6F50_012765 [Rhizopus delemar]KAG1614616.1 hypothetical protein G6F45_012594 [Rhizopus arrhizus]KAG1624784.1 hypothetical protein G6F44_012768 [Rhizopus delemar]
MTLSFNLPPAYTSHNLSTEIQRPHWNLKKLKKLDCSGRYESAFKNGTTSLVAQSDDDTDETTLMDMDAASTYIERYSSALCQAIYDSLDEICGKKDTTADGFLKQFWTTEMTSAFKRALLQRLIQQRRRETWKQFCSKMATGEYTKAIAHFSRIRKNRTIKPSFSPEPGINRAPADVMADHLKGIFAGHLLTLTPDLDSSPTLTSSPPFDLDLCPFSSDQIYETLKQLPRKKAPGIDHIQTEISISLTSTFRKLFEKCLYPSLLEQSPTLDIAQGGFRESRSSLDQVQCLIEICSILRRNHNSFPTLAFLDIKSAYDTVDRSYVWRELQSHLCPALLGILKNLFDHVQIEILLDNRVSYRFSPVTGVLQGSILSPFLYSLYINRLPSILRQPLLLDNSFSGDIVSDLTPAINCLLYADDVIDGTR